MRRRLFVQVPDKRILTVRSVTCSRSVNRKSVIRAASGLTAPARAIQRLADGAHDNNRIATDTSASNRSVVVTVNDRGPFVRGRVLDLALAPARELGLVGPGVAHVDAEVVN